MYFLASILLPTTLIYFRVGRRLADQMFPALFTMTSPRQWLWDSLAEVLSATLLAAVLLLVTSFILSLVDWVLNLPMTLTWRGRRRYMTVIFVMWFRQAYWQIINASLLQLAVATFCWYWLEIMVSRPM